MLYIATAIYSIFIIITFLYALCQAIFPQKNYFTLICIFLLFVISSNTHVLELSGTIPFFPCYFYFYPRYPCYMFSLLWVTFIGISVESGIPTPLGSFRNSRCCRENCQSGHHFPNHSSALHLIEIDDSYTIVFEGVSTHFPNIGSHG